MSQNIEEEPPSSPVGQAAADEKDWGHGEPVPKPSVQPVVSLTEIVPVVLVEDESLAKQHAPAEEVQISLSDGEFGNA
jgi:hypothetical protein